MRLLTSIQCVSNRLIFKHVPINNAICCIALSLIWMSCVWRCSMCSLISLHWLLLCSIGVICNATSGSRKVISKQTAKSSSSSLSPVISVFHLVSRHPLNTPPALPANLHSYTFPVFTVLTHIPPFSSVCTSWHLCCQSICICEQLVVQRISGLFVGVQPCSYVGVLMSSLLTTHLSQLSEHTKSRETN